MQTIVTLPKPNRRSFCGRLHVAQPLSRWAPFLSQLFDAVVDDCQDGRLPYRNTLAATVDDDQDEQREGRKLEGDWEDHPSPADVDVSLRYDGEPGEFVGV